MASMYDPSAYGGGAPTSGGAAAVGYALKGTKAIKDAILKRKGGKSDDERSSPSRNDTSGGPNPNPEDYRMAIPSTYKRGGMVRKTGLAKVHKGERVLTKAQQKRRKRGRGSRR